MPADQQPEGLRPLDDIVEGVDIIGTIIDKALPEISADLSQIKEHLQLLSERSGIADSESTETPPIAQVIERLSLIERRVLEIEAANQERYEELNESLEGLRLSIVELHEKLDTK
jgi:hypothetical protein